MSSCLTLSGTKSATKQTKTIFGLNGVTHLTSLQGIVVSCFILFDPVLLTNHEKQTLQLLLQPLIFGEKLADRLIGEHHQELSENYP